MDEEAVGATDNIVTEFHTYEDFLDSQITPLDLYYLEVCFKERFGEFYPTIRQTCDQNSVVMTNGVSDRNRTNDQIDSFAFRVFKNSFCKNFLVLKMSLCNLS